MHHGLNNMIIGTILESLEKDTLKAICRRMLQIRLEVHIRRRWESDMRAPKNATALAKRPGNE